jgi:hypothetical protein
MKQQAQWETDDNKVKQDQLWYDRISEDLDFDDKPYDWFLKNKSFINPTKTSLPKRHTCVCGLDQCTNLSISRWIATDVVIPTVKITRQDYRDFLKSKHKLIHEHKMRYTKIYVKVHHYPIEWRHLAFEKGDNQFLSQEGHYVEPRFDVGEIRDEIQMATEIMVKNPSLYYGTVMKHLAGRGDGTFSFPMLKGTYNSLSVPYCVLSQPITCKIPLELISGDMTNPDVLTKPTAETLVNDGKLNGSNLIFNMLRSHRPPTTAGSYPLIPDQLGIRAEEYLYYHVNARSPLKRTDEMPEMVTSTIPHSIASRRKTSRPAVRGSKHDISLRMATKTSTILQTLLPMNEAPKRTKARGRNMDWCIDKKMDKVGIVTKDFISQGVVHNNYSMTLCRDHEKGQNVYVDTKGNLPDLREDTNQQGRNIWKHAHYYLVGDVLTEDEVESAVQFCHKHNDEYLIGHLLLKCRMKGKANSEASKKQKLDNDMEEMCSNTKVAEAVAHFETFFERYLLSILRKVHLLQGDDFMRLVWGYWNIWNTAGEDSGVGLYSEEYKKKRDQTRRQGKDDHCTRIGGDDEAYKSTCYLHYFTILLHTGGM